MHDRNAKRHDECDDEREDRTPANHGSRFTQVTPEGNYTRICTRTCQASFPERKGNVSSCSVYDRTRITGNTEVDSHKIASVWPTNTGAIQGPSPHKSLEAGVRTHLMARRYFLAPASQLTVT
jgi:hypothetical protein